MQKFNNTSEIEPLKDFIGQDRAITAMELGLKIDNPSYNIYVAGELWNRKKYLYNESIKGICKK